MVCQINKSEITRGKWVYGIGVDIYDRQVQINTAVQFCVTAHQ